MQCSCPWSQEESLLRSPQVVHHKNQLYFLVENYRQNLQWHLNYAGHYRRDDIEHMILGFRDEILINACIVHDQNYIQEMNNCTGIFSAVWSKIWGSKNENHQTSSYFPNPEAPSLQSHHAGNTNPFVPQQAQVTYHNEVPYSPNEPCTNQYDGQTSSYSHHNTNVNEVPYRPIDSPYTSQRTHQYYDQTASYSHHNPAVEATARDQETWADELKHNSVTSSQNRSGHDPTPRHYGRGRARRQDSPAVQNQSKQAILMQNLGSIPKQPKVDNKSSFLNSRSSSTSNDYKNADTSINFTSNLAETSSPNARQYSATRSKPNKFYQEPKANPVGSPKASSYQLSKESETHNAKRYKDNSSNGPYIKPSVSVNGAWSKKTPTNRGPVKVEHHNRQTVQKEAEEEDWYYGTEVGIRESAKDQYKYHNRTVQNERQYLQHIQDTRSGEIENRSQTASDFQQPEVEIATEASEEAQFEILDIQDQFEDDLTLEELKKCRNRFEYVSRVKKHAEKLEPIVAKFKGTNYSIEYFVLDEKLMKLLEFLDKLKCQEEPEVLRAKIDTIQLIKGLHGELDARVVE